MGLLKRAWLPHLWSGLHVHFGAVAALDSFTVPGMTGAEFVTMVFHDGGGISGAIGFICEITDTWQAPI